jgi:threonine/homoserine/homoserine lactone efflux protein
MIELSQLYLFLIATLVLVLTPGPAVLYIVARSIDQGRKAGLVSALGVEVGTLFHIIAAALGVSALLATSALAFMSLKYLGAAYLIYLGARKILAREEIQTEESIAQMNLGRVFGQGMIVQVLNPKVALFFLAFLPQFVTPSTGSATMQIFILGGIFFGLALANDMLYALLAGTLGQWLKGNIRFLRGLRYFAGSVYIGLGVTTAFSGSSSKR